MAPNNPVMRSSDGVCLKDYVDTRFNEAQRAIDKAEKMMNLLVSKLDEDVEGLQKIADIAQGKASQNSVWIAVVIASISALISVIGMFMGK